MKKKILVMSILIIILGSFSACDKRDNGQATKTEEISTAPMTESQSATEVTTEVVTEATTQAPTTPVNKIDIEHINFYYNNRSKGARELVEKYEGPYTKGKDIAAYDVFVTNEATLPTGYFKDVWDTYWNKYPNDKNCKLGYEISFTTTDGKTINENILSPKDTESFFEYIEVYLYDDTNKARGQWYSHVLESEMNEKTILSSIKLTAGKNIEKVSDVITLTVFVYKDENDFSKETGEYRGSCKKTITYTRK